MTLEELEREVATLSRKIDAIQEHLGLKPTEPPKPAKKEKTGKVLKPKDVNLLGN